MALFKCKMCGGSIDITPGTTVVECEYCGTSQTLPKTTDENIQSLFNRANMLRQKNEFDKAETLYEKILEVAEDEAEAYWGVILCKYGIEYVEDPATFKRIPTCHRTSYDSIIADEYYKKALEHGDASQRTLYESEARTIDEIQKGILAISRKEEPFDVFICYKETDENGRRTQDSVVANEIYYELTDAGYKVFYAAITLESKLGSAYEPIIFAALNSSRVMLAIGTRPEYFNAVWVKNEWSRFLKMMRNDRKKLLIPCYRDMDAYDLPEEFAHLQAQDMSKIGFINDIVRGIEKVIARKKPSEVKEETPVKAAPQPTQATPMGASIASLLRRAQLFLEDSDWASADEYVEKVLDIDPECAEAYIVKLCAELKITNPEHLAYQQKRYSSHPIYKKALRFASPEYKARLTEYEGKVEKYLEQVRLEEEEKQREATYNQAKAAMSKYQFDHAIKLFRQLGDYRNSAKLLSFCEEEQKKERVYQEAKTLMERSGKEESLKRAIQLFRSIIKYRDSERLVENIERTLKSQEEERLYAAEKRRKEQEALIEAEKKRKQRTKIGVIVGAIVLLLIILNIAALIINANIDRELRGGVTYALEFDHYVVTGLESEDITDVVILAEYKGKPVRIGANAFENNTDITSVVISEGITEIGEYAFNGCTNLVSVTLPDSLTHIQGWAFMDCSSLEEIELPDGLTYIGYASFWDCKLIKELVVPDSVVEITAAAFHGCSSLESITLPFVGVTRNGTYPFGYIFGGSSYEGSVRANQRYLEKENNTQNGKVFDYYLPSSLKSVTITEGAIKYGAFSNCSSITSISILGDISYIGEYAFYGCESLANVTISDSVSVIEYYAFYNCDSLASITIPSNVTDIEYHAFFDCDSLTSVTIPISVTRIGDYSLSECDFLSQIKYRGTEEQWNAITKGYQWAFCSGSFNITYNYTEE